MLKKVTLTLKLIVAFLGVGLIPLTIISIISLNNSSESLKAAAFNQLHSIQAIKKNQIEGYFKERMGDISVLSTNPTVVAALQEFTKAFKKEGEKTGGPLWTAAESVYGSWLVQYKQEYGYYDLFLISNAGDVVYTVAKESDLGQNIVQGTLRSSSFGKCFTKSQRDVGFADFEPYAPSNGDPASFVGAPVRKDGKVIGSVALQIPIDGINNIMQERTGLGKTGETYLVGSDKLMRSDSYLDPTNHSVIASFKNPGKGKVDTEASRNALSGNEEQKIIIDYNGHPVLSAYAPLKVGDATWAVLAEIDKAEAFASIKALTSLIFTIGIVGAGIIIVIAWLFVRSIAKPLRNIFSGLKSLSDEELNETTSTFKKILEGLNGGAEQVASASGQLSSSSQQLSEGANEQASSLEEVSSSLEEMASITKQNADSAKQANTMASDASSSAKQGKDAMSRMSGAIDKIKESSDETAKIIKTIDEIAMQTNLLALNAAVEAARAGEAGRGFAVVAEEVRNLAQRSAEAAKNTADLIEESRQNSENGVNTSSEVGKILEQIIENVQKVAHLIAEVSAASDEQSKGIDQVNTAVSQMDKITQQNAANSEESASSSEELSSQAQNLNAMVAELASIVGRGEKKGTWSSTPVSNFQQSDGYAQQPVSSSSINKFSNMLHKPNETGVPRDRRVQNRGNFGHTREKVLVMQSNKEIDPQQVLPLDDDKDLRNF